MFDLLFSVFLICEVDGCVLCGYEEIDGHRTQVCETQNAMTGEQYYVSNDQCGAEKSWEEMIVDLRDAAQSKFLKGGNIYAQNTL